LSLHNHRHFFVIYQAESIEITHTIFWINFVGFAIFHIVNNWCNHGSSKRTSGKFKEFIVHFWFWGSIGRNGLEILEPVAEAGGLHKRPKRAETIEE
jgi:hypothetical protein